MKLAVVILAIWMLILELWVQNAERKSKAFQEEQKKEWLRKIQEREEWAKRYHR